MKQNKLIYGQNDLQGIVSIEPSDDGVEVFTQSEEGFVTSQFFENEHFILAHHCIDPHFKPLNGNLHYKWIKTYNNRGSFMGDARKYQNQDLFLFWNPKEAFMIRYGFTYYKGMKHGDVSALAFDIETTGLLHDANSKLLIISNTYSFKGKIERKLFTYDEYDDEGEMLKAWCEWVREKDPSIILGHNILMYDLPYMNFIAEKFGVKLHLGRDESEIKYSKKDVQFRKDANTWYEYKKAFVYGREVIDTLFLSYKYDIGRKYESYGLKKIIEQEGLEAKDRQFYDAGEIRHNYKNPVEWKKIKAYAEFDADDALALYNLMSPAFFYIAQSVARSYQHIIESATGGWINTIMNRAYLQEGHSLPIASQSSKFEGAISDGFAGIYSNCIKWDVASLYPSIIVTYDIYDKDKDPKRYFLELVRTFTEERLEYKKLAKNDKYYDDLSSAFKIFINSCYGFLGSKHSNFNYPKGAAEVTSHGREILKRAIKWATGKEYVESQVQTG